ncbi:MAG: hypothetical protein LBE71_00235 [Dysgonamonadaceae bacterium]|jgi:predicted helicase|nr:hypothetical protein [Dysgonamonadaceae bacterium]
MATTDEKLAQVFHFDLYGKREEKYNFLNENTLSSIDWLGIQPAAPNYFFVPKDFSLQTEYEKGFKINELFNMSGVGICSKRDGTAFQFEKHKIESILNDFKNLKVEQLKQKYDTEKSESRDKQTVLAKNNVLNFGIKQEYIQKASYRPFDIRWTYFTEKSKGFLAYPVYNLMQHFTKGENIGLVIAKQCDSDWRYVFITENIADLNLTATAAKFGGGYIFPLYQWKTFTNSQQPTAQKTIETVNLNKTVADKISKITGLQFMQLNTEILDFDAYAGEVYVKTKHTEKLFDYIYAVLHSPSYRERYKEFLKIDFPRIPYPENVEQFERLAAIGERLRKLHLMEDVAVSQNTANFPISGTNKIENSFPEKSNDYRDNKVWINNTQYFDNVPQAAWEFYIGGYQPAQKWLKDRKGRKLDYDDVQHYQKMIAVLCETERIMKEISMLLLRG